MTPDWVDYRNDLCYGDSDSNGAVDTFNRPNKTIWGNMTSFTGAENFGAGTGEHIKTGAHMDDLDDALWNTESITYTGDGTDDRDISLSGSIDIKFIRIWDGAVAYTFFRSEDMAGDTTRITSLGSGFVADYIQSVGTGTFQVGTTLNVNLRVYYGIVYGV